MKLTQKPLNRIQNLSIMKLIQKPLNHIRDPSITKPKQKPIAFETYRLWSWSGNHSTVALGRATWRWDSRILSFVCFQVLNRLSIHSQNKWGNAVKRMTVITSHSPVSQGSMWSSHVLRSWIRSLLQYLAPITQSSAKESTFACPSTDTQNVAELLHNI